MAKNIEPKLKKIGDYLKLEEDTVFEVPEYQRAYSWGITNCDKLWQDIIDFVDSGNKDRYFFGTIIINCQDNDKKYALIDGQQRTTTFLLLLKALLVKINYVLSNTKYDEESETLYSALKQRRRTIMGILYKVEPEEVTDKPNAQKDVEIYKRDIILDNHSINEQQLFKGELSNILKSVDFEEAERYSKKIPYKQKDNKYSNYLRNFKFFYGKVCDLREPELNTIAKTITENCEVIEIKSWDVEQAIKMFNSLNSDGLPLFDSDLISAQMYAEADSKNCKEEYVKLWEELVEKINDLIKSDVADINSILMQYMYYVRTINGEITTDTGSINVTTPGLRRYFISDNDKPIKNPIQTCTDLNYLASFWNNISDYTLVKLLLKFNENSKLFLASYFFRLNNENVEEKDICVILECLLRLFAVLELVDSGYSSKNFKTFLFGELERFVDNNVSIDDIKNDFDSHINSKWNRESIIDTLNDYNGNLLVYLNEYLFAKEKSVDFTLGTKYDIEHIMPNSGNNIAIIRSDAGIEDADEFASIVNKLGNKILLESKINRSIGNEWFRTKVSTRLGDKTGYIDSAYPIACSLVETYKDKPMPIWTKDDIKTATEQASTRIADFIFNG